MRFDKNEVIPLLMIKSRNIGSLTVLLK